MPLSTLSHANLAPPADRFVLEQAFAARIDDAMLADRPRLRQQLENLRQRHAAGQPADRLIADIGERLARSEAVVCARRSTRPPVVEFPDSLPITAYLPAIATALEQHPVIVVCGETGSGKTTQLAKLCLHLGRGVHGRIGHTQPRRIAARAVAARIGVELATPQAVGHSVRFDDTLSPGSAIQVLTDGLLLAHTQSDPDLLQYDTLIIDEAHERSLNVDFLLGYLHRLLPRRPDLRLIITSATIDPQRFADHFGGAPVIEISGRDYPVELRYRPLITPDLDQADRSLVAGVVAAVLELTSEGAGDVLVFLPGEREIRGVADALRTGGPAGVDTVPLYARLSRAEQDRVFQPAKRRRIVLATNVAETSLTVPGIRYVVDSGLARIGRYGTRTQIQRLNIEKISQAAAQQRAGRCGRVAPGVCIRLYAEDDFANRSRFTDPEIHRASLASVVLRMQALQLGDAADFPFMDPPQRRHLRAARRTLYELDALDSAGALTTIGHQLARFPLDPAVGRMLIEAARTGALREVLIIAAALTVQDPRERPLDARERAHQAHRLFADARSDFLTLLTIYRAFEQEARYRSQTKLRTWCREHFLSYLRLREWRDVVGQLTALANGLGLRTSKLDADYEPIHRALLAGLLGRVARRMDNAGGRGRTRPGRELEGAHGSTLRVFPGSALASKPPRWLMAAELIDTGRLYARTVAHIEAHWIEAAAAHLVRREHTEPHWDIASRRPVAYQRVTLYGLTLVRRRRVPYGPIDPEHARAIFIRDAIIDGALDADCPALAANRRLLAELETLQAKARRPLLIDEEGLSALYAARLPAEVWDGHRFAHWLRRAPADALRLGATDLLLGSSEKLSDFDSPDRLEVGNARLPLHYRYAPGQEDDGITVCLPRALLGRCEKAVFDWLIPGWLQEKCTALIRTLPGPLRRQFVPAPDYAQQALAKIEPGKGALLEALAGRLTEMTQHACPVEAFAVDNIERHLRFRFEVVDEHGNRLASGRDLAQLQARFASCSDTPRPGRAPHPLERIGITNWDFGALPRHISTPGPAGAELLRWPALVDQGDTCAIRLFDDLPTATRAHRNGVRTLLAHALAAELPRANSLPAATVVHRRLGPAAQVLRELQHAIIDQAWGGQPLPRGQEAFAALVASLRPQLPPLSATLTQTVTTVLSVWRTLLRQIDGVTTFALLDVVGDLRQQLERLIYAGFLATTPTRWLPELPRYLKAAAMRLDRARLDPAADRRNSQDMQPLWQAFWESHPRPADAGVIELRWLLEELRVALFAPTLATLQPVSVARLTRLLKTSNGDH